MVLYDLQGQVQVRVSKGRDVPRDVPGQTGTGRPVVPLSRDKKKILSRCPVVPGQGQKQMSRDKFLCPGPSRGKTIKCTVLEHHFPVFLFFWEAYFVPGRDGTEEFVPGHLLLPLSRDKGTPGQEFFFVPGQRDNGTSRPVETLVCMYLNFNGFIE